MSDGKSRTEPRAELAVVGAALAAALAREAKRYHVKSDQHEILGYEAGTVAAYTEELLGKARTPDHLRGSTLLGAWGSRYAWDNRELVSRTRAFFEELRKLIPE